MKHFPAKHLLRCSLIISLLFIISCKEDKDDAAAVTERQVCLAEGANLLTVTGSPVIQKIRFNGKVAYNPNAVVNYVSLVGGVINNSFITLGDQVEKNQVLAEIKSAALNSIEAEVQQTRSFLTVAQRHLVSTRGLYDDGIASEKDLIIATSEVDNLKSELHRLQTNLQLYSASSEKGVFQIKAPVSGYIVDNNLSFGMQISAEGEPLFTISNLDEVWVNFNIYTTDIHLIKEGMEVEITTSAYPSENFTGKIDRISQVIDPVENVIKARVVMENTRMLLKPGLNVEAIVKVDNGQTAWKLPNDAVVFHNDKYYSIVVNSQCDMSVRQLNIVSRDERMVYIDQGLEEGEKVITDRALLFFDELFKDSI